MQQYIYKISYQKKQQQQSSQTIYFKGHLIAEESANLLNWEYGYKQYSSIYFVLKNGLSNLHWALSNSSDILISKCSEELDRKYTWLISVNICLFVIIGVFASVFIPITIKFQKNKRNLLMIFVQIPLESIKEICNKSKVFLENHLLHLQRSNIEAPEISDSQTIQARFGIRPISSSNEIQEERKSTIDIVIDKLKRKNSKAENTEEKIDEDTDEKDILIQEKNKDEKFSRERMKAVEKISLPINTVTIVVLLSFIIILGYLSKILYHTIKDRNNLKEMIEGTEILNRRFVYMSSLMIFFKSFLTSYESFQYTMNGENLLQYYYKKTIENEDKIFRMTYNPKYGLREMSQKLQEYDNTGFCKAYSSTLNLEIAECLSLFEGTANEGLFRMISFMLISFREIYFNTVFSSNITNSKLELMNGSRYAEFTYLFVNVLDPLFDIIYKLSGDIFSKKQVSDFYYKLLDFVILIIFSFFFYFLLIKFFLKNMEDEIYMARRIVTILPEKMLKKQTLQSILREERKFSEQFNYSF